jgi:uncharacterized membrane protein
MNAQLLGFDPAIFSIADALAVALVLLCWLATGHVIEKPPARHPSVSVLMKEYRREWMVHFLTRDPRIFDATIVDSLRQGTAFFASASMIAIGGLLALMGNTAPVEGLARDLTLAPDAAPLVWKVRLLPALFLVVDAFLNFVWSHRLFGYCAVVMAAAPNEPADPLAIERARKSGEINIHAAKNFNRGLRSVYFAMGALTWLVSPLALALGTMAVVAMILRREFWSQSRRILMGDTPK